MKKHIFIVIFAVLIGVVFTFVLFTFQLKSNESAVITTFGRITGCLNGKDDAGLHFRWPYPIQDKIVLNNSIFSFSGNVGSLEETLTRDGKNIIVGIYVMYRISDPVKFVKKVDNGIYGAEELLNSAMVNIKNSVLGDYNFDQLINTDKSKLKLKQIQDEIKSRLSAVAEDSYGLEIVSAGINRLNIPESITVKVFDRMKKEREKFAAAYRAEGKRKAAIIRSRADSDRAKMLSQARAEAKEILAEGDAEAAKYYADFAKDPELAKFLRKLSSLKKVMEKNTTLILDTDSVPFDLLQQKSSDRIESNR